MKHLIRTLIALAALAAALVAVLTLVWLLKPELYIRTMFPSPPDLPTPIQSLSKGQQGRIHYPSKTYYDLDILLSGAGQPATGVGDLYLPEPHGGGAIPAMIVAHGSGGIQPGREQGYAQLLNRRGIAAFVIDYYAPRGADGDVNYMIKVLSVTEFDVISDLYHALAILRTHPRIDPDRIGVMGMSYGGMAARFAVDSRIKRALIGEQPGFAAVIDIYGPCFQNLRSAAATPAPMLTLRGTEDASNDLAACAQREQELRDLGLTVETEIYEGAGHAWENDSPRALKEDAPYVTSCEMTYDARGFPSVNGQQVIPPDLAPSRETRILSRMNSGDKMLECVRHGYIIGRDEAVKARADQRIVRFLRQHL